MQPSLFISHGAPDVAITPSPVRDFLINFGKEHPRPDAIIIASAHYETLAPEIGAAAEPATIYDFGGFQPELYEMRYRTEGDPELAERVRGVFASEGIEASLNPQRGLDHGIWTPLILAYPDGEVPVVPVSVQPNEDASHHYRLGRALEKFRAENMLVVGSGHITHNLRAMFHAMRGGGVDPQTAAAIDAFTGWIGDRLKAGDRQGLLNWQEDAPFALENHPTAEHFMPLFVAYGAGGENPKAELIHSSKLYGAFNSDFWLFH